MHVHRRISTYICTRMCTHSHMYTYIAHIHICAHMHTATHEHTYTHIFTHIGKSYNDIHIYSHMHTSPHVCTYIHICTHLYTYMHIHMYIHMCTHLHTYIHIYTHGAFECRPWHWIQELVANCRPIVVTTSHAVTRVSSSTITCTFLAFSSGGGLLASSWMTSEGSGLMRTNSSV